MKAEDLKDLSQELKAIHELENLKEKSPGIFYYKSLPFLHFHDKDGVRWADIKSEGQWLKLEINFAASAGKRAVFLKKVRAGHTAFARK